MVPMPGRLSGRRGSPGLFESIGFQASVVVGPFGSKQFGEFRIQFLRLLEQCRIE